MKHLVRMAKVYVCRLVKRNFWVKWKYVQVIQESYFIVYAGVGGGS